MSSSPKYQRELNQVEEMRLIELKWVYKKAMEQEYNKEIINCYTNETLMDVACSKWRYNQSLKYYNWLKEQIRLETEINETREYDNDELLILNLLHKKENMSTIGIEINETVENDIEHDMKKAKTQFDNCYDLMQSRNSKYWDSWKKLRTNSIIDLISMKLDRCVKQELDNKAMEVELEDIVNYAIFWLIKIRNQNQK